MGFEQISEYVDVKLSTFNLDQKVLLFRDVLGYPVDFSLNKYFYLGQEWTDLRMKDFLSITQHWLSVKEYDKLYEHLKKLNEF